MCMWLARMSSEIALEIGRVPRSSYPKNSDISVMRVA